MEFEIVCLLLVSIIIGINAAPVSNEDFTLERDCVYDGKVYGHGLSIGIEDPCLNCTCNRGVLVCFLRVCPNLVPPPNSGCTLQKTPGTCCAELVCGGAKDKVTTTTTTTAATTEVPAEPRVDEDVGGTSTSWLLDEDVTLPAAIDFTVDDEAIAMGCRHNGSVYAEGSAMLSSSFCEYCYCIRGSHRCIRPQCDLLIDGCKPIFQKGFSCCPTAYQCKHNASDEYITTTTTASSKPTVKRNDCEVNGTLYAEGDLVDSLDVCSHCFCMGGNVRCSTIACPLQLDGCTPIIQRGKCCPTGYNCSSSPSYKTAIETDVATLVSIETSDGELSVTDIVATEWPPTAEDVTTENGSTTTIDWPNDMSVEEDGVLATRNNDRHLNKTEIEPVTSLNDSSALADNETWAVSWEPAGGTEDTDVGNATSTATADSSSTVAESESDVAGRREMSNETVSADVTVRLDTTTDLSSNESWEVETDAVTTDAVSSTTTEFTTPETNNGDVTRLIHNWITSSVWHVTSQAVDANDDDDGDNIISLGDFVQTTFVPIEFENRTSNTVDFQGAGYSTEPSSAAGTYSRAWDVIVTNSESENSSETRSHLGIIFKDSTQSVGAEPTDSMQDASTTDAESDATTTTVAITNDDDDVPSNDDNDVPSNVGRVAPAARRNDTFEDELTVGYVSTELLRPSHETTVTPFGLTYTADDYAEQRLAGRAPLNGSDADDYDAAAASIADILVRLNGTDFTTVNTTSHGLLEALQSVTRQEIFNSSALHAAALDVSYPNASDRIDTIDGSDYVLQNDTFDNVTRDESNSEHGLDTQTTTVTIRYTEDVVGSTTASPETSPAPVSSPHNHTSFGSALTSILSSLLMNKEPNDTSNSDYLHDDDDQEPYLFEASDYHLLNESADDLEALIEELVGGGGGQVPGELQFDAVNYLHFNESKSPAPTTDDGTATHAVNDLTIATTTTSMPSSSLASSPPPPPSDRVQTSISISISESDESSSEKYPLAAAADSTTTDSPTTTVDSPTTVQNFVNHTLTNEKDDAGPDLSLTAGQSDHQSVAVDKVITEIHSDDADNDYPSSITTAGPESSIEENLEDTMELIMNLSKTYATMNRTTVAWKPQDNSDDIMLKVNMPHELEARINEIVRLAQANANSSSSATDTATNFATVHPGGDYYEDYGHDGPLSEHASPEDVSISGQGLSDGGVVVPELNGTDIVQFNRSDDTVASSSSSIVPDMLSTSLNALITDRSDTSTTTTSVHEAVDDEDDTVDSRNDSLGQESQVSIVVEQGTTTTTDFKVDDDVRLPETVLQPENAPEDVTGDNGAKDPEWLEDGQHHPSDEDHHHVDDQLHDFVDGSQDDDNDDDNLNDRAEYDELTPQVESSNISEDDQHSYFSEAEVAVGPDEEKSYFGADDLNAGSGKRHDVVSPSESNTGTEGETHYDKDEAGEHTVIMSEDDAKPTKSTEHDEPVSDDNSESNNPLDVVTPEHDRDEGPPSVDIADGEKLPDSIYANDTLDDDDLISVPTVRAGTTESASAAFTTTPTPKAGSEDDLGFAAISDSAEASSNVNGVVLNPPNGTPAETKDESVPVEVSITQEGVLNFKVDDLTERPLEVQTVEDISPPAFKGEVADVQISDVPFLTGGIGEGLAVVELDPVPSLDGESPLHEDVTASFSDDPHHHHHLLDFFHREHTVATPLPPVPEYAIPESESTPFIGLVSKGSINFDNVLPLTRRGRPTASDQTSLAVPTPRKSDDGPTAEMPDEVTVVSDIQVIPFLPEDAIADEPPPQPPHSGSSTIEVSKDEHGTGGDSALVTSTSSNGSDTFDQQIITKNESTISIRLGTSSVVQKGTDVESPSHGFKGTAEPLLSIKDKVMNVTEENGTSTSGSSNNTSSTTDSASVMADTSSTMMMMTTTTETDNYQPSTLTTTTAVPEIQTVTSETSATSDLKRKEEKRIDLPLAHASTESPIDQHNHQHNRGSANLDVAQLSQDYCVENGEVFLNGERIPTLDFCAQCRCNKGEIQCQHVACPRKPPGCVEKIVPSSCCPSFVCKESDSAARDEPSKSLPVRSGITIHGGFLPIERPIPQPTTFLKPVLVPDESHIPPREFLAPTHKVPIVVESTSSTAKPPVEYFDPPDIGNQEPSRDDTVGPTMDHFGSEHTDKGPTRDSPAEESMSKHGSTQTLNHNLEISSETSENRFTKTATTMATATRVMATTTAIQNLAPNESLPVEIDGLEMEGGALSPEVPQFHLENDESENSDDKKTDEIIVDAAESENAEKILLPEIKVNEVRPPLSSTLPSIVTSFPVTTAIAAETTTTTPSTTAASFDAWPVLKVSGCNIYGRVYQLGSKIGVLSGPCKECKCTETGVDCYRTKCF